MSLMQHVRYKCVIVTGNIPQISHVTLTKKTSFFSLVGIFIVIDHFLTQKEETNYQMC